MIDQLPNFSLNGASAPPEMRAEVVTITPEMAEQWLAKNTRNRTLKKSKIEQYARDMEAGHWRLTGEAIKWSYDGRILDGQNRLHAVIRAGKPIRTWVIWGIDPAAQDVMDSGSARTAADALSMAGLKNAKNITAAARIAMAIEEGHKSFHKKLYSNSEVQEWVMNHIDITEATSVLGQDSRLIPLPSSVRLYCAWRLMQIDRDTAVDFFEQLGSGLGLTAGSPVLALRRRLGGNYGAARRITPTEQITAVFRTWNAFREGRTLARVLGNDKNNNGIPAPV